MSSALSSLSATDLIGKGIAPVKREYWKPNSSRQEVAAVGSSEAPESAAPAERKSKRQAKRVSTMIGVSVLNGVFPGQLYGSVQLRQACVCRSAGTRNRDQLVHQFLGRDVRVQSKLPLQP